MRVCIIKATGKLFESQGGNDKAGFGALIKNAAAAGYAEKDISLSIKSDDEVRMILESEAPPKTRSVRDMLDELRPEEFAAVLKTSLSPIRAAEIAAKGGVSKI
jgi:hypothetical protein